MEMEGSMCELQISELYFILSNAFAIAGLVMASLSGIKSGTQTVIDQAYNTNPFFETMVVNGNVGAINIPEDAIKQVLKEKYNQGFGLLFAAIGIAIPIIVNTTKPTNGRLILTFIFAFILYNIGIFITWLVVQFRVRKIIKKLENGEVKTSTGFRIHVTDVYQVPNNDRTNNE